MWKSVASAKIVGKMAKRLFIAVDISADCRDAAARFAASLRHDFPTAKVKWEHPDKLHLTLKFLGSVEPSQVAAIRDAIVRVVADVTPFELTILDAGVFPNPRKPRVLWLGVKAGAKDLSRLAAEIDKNLPKGSFVDDKSGFFPHCTIGRVKGPDSATELAGAIRDRRFGPISWMVTEVVIYESTLLPTGSVYKAVERIPLLLS